MEAMEAIFTIFRMMPQGIIPTTLQSHDEHNQLTTVLLKAEFRIIRKFNTKITKPKKSITVFLLLRKTCSHFCHPSAAASTLCYIVKSRCARSFPWFSFLFSVWNTRRTPVTAHVLLSTLHFDLLRGTFAVFLCQSPLIFTVLKHAPPSLALCLPSHLAKTKQKPKTGWTHLHRPAAGRAPRLWSEARYERLTAFGEIIQWLCRILNWADWVVGETSGPPETPRGHCLAMICNRLRLHQAPRKLCCRYELWDFLFAFFFFFFYLPGCQKLVMMSDRKLKMCI